MRTARPQRVRTACSVRLFIAERLRGSPLSAATIPVIDGPKRAEGRFTDA